MIGEICEKGERYTLLLQLPDCKKVGYCEYQREINFSFQAEDVTLRVCGLVLGDKDISNLPIIRTVANQLERNITESHTENHT